jgi:sirohydrochlorin cobaltochelatase
MTRASATAVLPPGYDVPLTILVGAVERGSQRPLEALAGRLARRLGHDVVAWGQATPLEKILDAIQERIEGGTVRLVVLPLALGPADRVHGAVIELVAAVRDRWPGVCVHRGAAPSPDDVARILGDRAREATAGLSRDRASTAGTVVLLAAAGGASPARNAELARLARLVYEAHRFVEVGYAFLDPTPPTVGESIVRWHRLGARALVLVPCTLFAGAERRRIGEEARRASRGPSIQVAVARTVSPHPALIGALVRRHLEALQDGAVGGVGTAGSAPYVRPELLLALRHAHRHDAGPLAELEARMAAMLPPRYQDAGATVSAAPMGAAPLQRDPDGAVAWDRVWQGFCELALAGGPPHRGSLLEAAPREEVLANPSRQAEVLQELARGIRAITQLDVILDGPPGWIGVVCHSESMAIWLLRAIVVENVIARREGVVLYLPAGPGFTLDGEIKNVVTAVAKTHHYWIEHVTGTPPPGLRGPLETRRDRNRASEM